MYVVASSEDSATGPMSSASIVAAPVRPGSAAPPCRSPSSQRCSRPQQVARDRRRAPPCASGAAAKCRGSWHEKAASLTGSTRRIAPRFTSMPPAQVEPVDTRQHDVQDDEVGRARLECLDARRAVVQHLDDVTAAEVALGRRPCGGASSMAQCRASPSTAASAIACQHGSSRGGHAMNRAATAAPLVQKRARSRGGARPMVGIRSRGRVWTRKISARDNRRAIRIQTRRRCPRACPAAGEHCGALRGRSRGMPGGGHGPRRA